MNETYSAWVRGRLPKYEKPSVEFIDNLNPSVIIDQSRLGGNARSTVGTISDMYSLLRLLFSKIGTPSAEGNDRKRHDDNGEVSQKSNQADLIDFQ